MNMQTLEHAADCVFERLNLKSAQCTMILGSGWSAAADAFHTVSEIDYADIPGLGAPGVKGHRGCLRHCRLNGADLLLFLGRRHVYEGAGWTPIAIPVYLAIQAGIKTLLLANAAGGINAHLAPGDLMLITDHINAMGSNPLIGAHQSVWGKRFPDQSAIYHTTLRYELQNVAARAAVELKEGVYLATSGPAYETPAEIRAYRTLGADAVGMSTVPEAILANAAGLDVAGISCISNLAAGVSHQPLEHADVLQTTQRMLPSMTAIIREFAAYVCSASH